MSEAVAVVETAAEAAVQAGPVVNTGLLDPKKVAIAAAATVAVAGCGYICYRMIKKRKAAKAVEVNPAEEEIVEIVEIEEEAPKAKAKK